MFSRRLDSLSVTAIAIISLLLLLLLNGCHGWIPPPQIVPPIIALGGAPTGGAGNGPSGSCTSSCCTVVDSNPRMIQNPNEYIATTTRTSTRRSVITAAIGITVGFNNNNHIIHHPNVALAVDAVDVPIPLKPEQQQASPPTSSQPPVQVSLTGDTLKLFNEGRTYEQQGNIMAAQRLYGKVTQMAPRYIYGWSNLGNTQVILNPDLTLAEQSYNTAIHLCQESIQEQEQLLLLQSNGGNTFGIKRCSDLYVLLLNRGCLRLNTGQYREALMDLQQAELLRGPPDPIILQNLARAYEYTGNYQKADYDYTLAISMSNSNEVNPFWLRSAMVKFQLGSIQSGLDLLKRVLNRFPDAPEVRAAYAVFLLERNPNQDMTMEVQQTFLDIPIRQRLKYSDREYITKTICWPPAMIERLNRIIKAVGDDKRSV